ncbi:MAG: hypothetical protein ACHP6I_02670 [Rickettsiales bacterium]
MVLSENSSLAEIIKHLSNDINPPVTTPAETSKEHTSIEYKQAEIKGIISSLGEGLKDGDYSSRSGGVSGQGKPTSSASR